MAFASPSVRGQVLQIAWPVIVENLLQTLLGVVNLWMVSRLGIEAIAGVGNALQYLMVGFAGLGAIGVGSTVLVAHAVGSGDKLAAGRVAKQSLEIAVIVGVVIGALGWVYAYPANLVLGVTPGVAEIGAIYLRIVAAGAIPLVMMFILSAVLRGIGNSRTPMQVTLVVNFISAGLSYWLIFGGFGVDALGVAGAAWGSALSRGIGCAILLGYLLIDRPKLGLLADGGWRPDRQLVSKILTIGIPSGVEQFLISGGFLLLTGIIAQMGTNVLAAHRVVFQALSFSNMPGMGFGVAATTLTGIHMGARRVDLAEQATWIAARWALLWMSALAIIFFFFGEQVMLLFAPNEPEVVHYGAQALKVMAFTQPCFAIVNAFAGGLRGAGDTRFPMYMAAIGMWVIRLPGANLLGLTLGWGLAGVYAASVVDGAIRAVIFVVRYRRGNWKNLDVLKGMNMPRAGLVLDEVVADEAEAGQAVGEPADRRRLARPRAGD